MVGDGRGGVQREPVGGMAQGLGRSSRPRQRQGPLGAQWRLEGHVQGVRQAGLLLIGRLGIEGVLVEIGVGDFGEAPGDAPGE